MTHEASRFASLVNTIAPTGTLIEACQLTGGVSATVTRLSIATGGCIERVVVREHGARDRARNPHIAAFEFDLLSALVQSGLPVPAPVLSDDAGTLVGRPMVVVQYLPGSSDGAPADEARHMRLLARGLAEIHEAVLPKALLSLLPRHGDRVEAMLARASDGEPVDRQARAILIERWPPEPRNRPVLLHADYWPGNILWSDGAISGIIDWEDAALGDPLADLAATRLELLWAHGDQSLRTFTASYLNLRQIDIAELALFQLAACLEALDDLPHWGLAPDVQRRMIDQTRELVAEMLEALPHSAS